MKIFLFAFLLVNFLFVDASATTCKGLSIAKCKKNPKCVATSAFKRGKSKVAAYCRKKAKLIRKHKSTAKKIKKKSKKRIKRKAKKAKRKSAN